MSATWFQLLLSFAHVCGGAVPDSHQSSTDFEECRDLIAETVKTRVALEARESPFFALSVDEKEAMLIILITFVPRHPFVPTKLVHGLIRSCWGPTKHRWASLKFSRNFSAKWLSEYGYHLGPHFKPC